MKSYPLSSGYYSKMISLLQSSCFILFFTFISLIFEWWYYINSISNLLLAIAFFSEKFIHSLPFILLQPPNYNPTIYRYIYIYFDSQTQKTLSPTAKKRIQPSATKNISAAPRDYYYISTDLIKWVLSNHRFT